MIKKAGIMFNQLPDENFDPIFGVGSGAGHLFGATGGVTEAALRTVSEILDGKPLENLEFTDVRGTSGIKEASYTIAGKTLNICVCSGLKNAKQVLDSVKSGEKNYHMIEIMACPGGCVNGGGQPIQTGDTRNNVDLKTLRAKALYDEDKELKVRRSHDNPVIKELYASYFGEPGSHRAHEVLHTSFHARKKYK
jgi:NADP-reducing hydrogenase subunit HndD